MSQQIVLSYENYRYLKRGLFLLLLAILGYVLHEPAYLPNGGTWLGYTLGTISALLIVGLMLFGIRKRSYSSTLGTVRGWLSAHIYLGLSLVILATLHTGFQFGWNIHTLAYVLMMIVIISGVWGLVMYWKNPSLMGQQLHGQTLEDLVKNLRDIDKQLQRNVAELNPKFEKYIQQITQGVIFSSWLQKLTVKNKHCPTLILGKQWSENAQLTPDEHTFYVLILKRIQTLKHIRHYIRFKTWTELWLMFHVPLSFALLAVLLAHIISVFFYW